MDFVLDRSEGGLGPLRWGMSDDEAVAALDRWRQQPGPRAQAVRDSGLCISPGFGGRMHSNGHSPVSGVYLSRPLSDADRVLFDGLDLFSGPLEVIVDSLRKRGHRVDYHDNGVYTINDMDVWLRLERMSSSESPYADSAGLVVSPRIANSGSFSTVRHHNIDD
jgi:hypothetical protein